MTAPFQNIVKIKNAKTLVLKSYVVLEQAVKLKLTELFVNVHLATLAIHLAVAQEPQVSTLFVLASLLTVN